jgi:Tfp pilus assembly protein PilV
MKSFQYLLRQAQDKLRQAQDDGFLLLEVAVTYVIAGFTIIALASVVTLALTANTASEETMICGQLAHELMQEIQLKKWDENSSNTRPGYPAAYPSATLGPEAGENAADKTTFDDIDDFNGWTETPPQDPIGRTLTAFPDYTRTVTVQYVTSTFSVSASTSSYKLVKVCVNKKMINKVCLDWVAGNH